MWPLHWPGGWWGLLLWLTCTRADSVAVLPGPSWSKEQGWITALPIILPSSYCSAGTSVNWWAYVLEETHRWKQEWSIGQDRKCPLHCTPLPRVDVLAGTRADKANGEAFWSQSWYQYGCTTVFGIVGKKVAMGLCNRGLFCKATSVRFFISSEIEVDILAD